MLCSSWHAWHCTHCESPSRQGVQNDSLTPSHTLVHAGAEMPDRYGSMYRSHCNAQRVEEMEQHS